MVSHTLCPYCLEIRTDFVRHLTRIHRNEHQVVHLINLQPRSGERSSMIAALRDLAFIRLAFMNHPRYREYQNYRRYYRRY